MEIEMKVWGIFCSGEEIEVEMETVVKVVFGMEKLFSVFVGEKM